MVLMKQTHNYCFRTVMSNLRAGCSPVEGFVWPSFGFHYSKSILYSDKSPYFDNLECDSFDAGGLQCHIVTSVTITARI